jgi:hypothetical protein
MSITAVLAPVFVEVALTFALLFWLGTLRVRLVRSGAVKPRDVALGEPNWPPQVLQIANAYRSQLELPVLFYLVLVLAAFSGRASVALMVLAWLFVAARLLHALVHVTTNNLARRFALFLAGAVILAVMWLLFLGQLILAP